MIYFSKLTMQDNIGQLRHENAIMKTILNKKD